MYVNSYRLKALLSFRDKIVSEEIEPYDYLISCDWLDHYKILWSLYHYDYYSQYFLPPKAERFTAFEHKLDTLSPVSPAHRAIYIIRTALMEGVMPLPSLSEDIQAIEGQQNDFSCLMSLTERMPMESIAPPYYEALMNFYQSEGAEFSEAIVAHQRQIVPRLAWTRNQLLQFQGSTDNWGRWYLLWHYLMWFDVV